MTSQPHQDIITMREWADQELIQIVIIIIKRFSRGVYKRLISQPFSIAPLLILKGYRIITMMIPPPC
jgi:hypothetical protein